MSAPTQHRQVVASNGVQVDEGIRDLLEALWSHGMVTEFSCQCSQDNLAHICFTHAADANRFTQAPGDFLVTAGESRVWVDFPSDRIDDLARYWSMSGGR
jgi:hypothetical protein